MKQAGKKYRMAFYGDDFTGSTDALEFLSRAGANTVLFLDPPDEEMLSRYPGLDAFGVAGMTRAVSPSEMETILQPAFQRLSVLDVEHVHYKVCSTFDSSPFIGSIGKAIDIGAAVFNNRYTPLMVGAPVLGRYCVFGNLFARMGIGSEGRIFRLDRHPSMSKHPVTPSDESDLRIHLSKQTSKKTCLVDILAVHQSPDAIINATEKRVEEKAEIILFDTLHENDLLWLGQLLVREAAKNSPLFSAGSSAIEMALGRYWNSIDAMQAITSWPQPGPVQPLLILSGSCSPVSISQIRWAVENGFEEMGLDLQKSAPDEDAQVLECICQKSKTILQQGKNLIIHSSPGSAVVDSNEKNFSVRLGSFLGKLAKTLAAASGLKRIVVAGGDTSSYAARAMGIEAVQMIAPIVPGAPLCRAIAPCSPVDGLELNFKGGQVGGENYFGQLALGKLNI